MTGSLQHLGGDRYRVRVYAGRDPLQPERQVVVSKSFRAKNEREARKASSRHIVDLQKRVESEQGGTGTIGELVTLWERDRVDFSPSTKKRNRSILATIRADLGRIPARRLTTLQVDQWFAMLRSRGLGESTVGQYGRVLSKILSDGKRWKKVDVNVADDARRPKPPKAEIEPPTMGEVVVLLEAARGDLRGALEVLARTGCRRSEAVGLRWSDIKGGRLIVQRTIHEMPNGQWLARSPKSRKGREVEIDPKLLLALAAQRERQESWFAARGTTPPKDCFIFANLAKDGTGETPRRPGWLSLGFARLCMRTGVDTHLHALRHWNASSLIAQGVPVTTVSRRLGHAQTSTTTNIYGHGTDVGEAKAIEVLSGLL